MEKIGKGPDVLLACVGGGSNAIGLFHAFVDDPNVRLIGIEAGGLGIESGKHAATLTQVISFNLDLSKRIHSSGFSWSSARIV